MLEVTPFIPKYKDTILFKDMLEHYFHVNFCNLFGLYQQLALTTTIILTKAGIND